ncbi:phosphotransferase [Jeotgalibacillus sp. R-1-5s-1]|uniref:phosphotransferase n=1 Tax=Jeotgalibacillus sp. R-1-5s-1 TaxID=2555897 RepID=UPI00106D9F58|nr:phosphotransferase [Jeotgalibacillus sp. R-1-5s-1]TFE00830.1 hypothetical protein E2491_04795 [Jeotgalibacillus sp. R-1-5s-1]
MGHKSWSEEELRDVLNEFGLKNIKRISVFRKEVKVLAEVESGQTVYFLKGEASGQAFVERACEFADMFLGKGIPFPTYHQSESGWTIEKKGVVFTLEKKCAGNEKSSGSIEIVQKIAKALAKQHLISESVSFRFNTGTTWSLFGGNQTDNLGDYDENEQMIQLFEEKMYDHEMSQRVLQLAHEKRQLLNKHWPELPTGPVQGDFCYYNMTFDENGDISGIYDLNLAGDEVLVNECVAVGIYHSWIMPYTGEESSHDRFLHFLAAYQKVRKLSALEQSFIVPLYQLTRAFRFDRIEPGVKKTGIEREQFLEATLNILCEELAGSVEMGLSLKSTVEKRNRPASS